MTVPGILIAVLFFILGLLGTVLPFLPGAPLIWLGMFLYGLITGFVEIGWQFLLLQGIIVLIIFAIDYVAGAWGAGRYGGSKAAAAGSIIGGVIGIFTLGPAGVVMGPFIGAMLAELLKGKSLHDSFKVGFGTLVGFLGGTALKIILELIMIAWFFIKIII